MNGDSDLARQVADLRSSVADLSSCLEGRVSERHESILDGVEALASTAEGAIGRERAGRAKAEAASTRFQGIVHDLDAVVWTADAETGRYSFISHHAEEALGYPVGRWLAEPDFWASYIHPEDLAYATKNRMRCREGSPHVEFEYRAVTASGRLVWFREQLRSAAGDGPGRELRGQMWDITGRKRVERQLYEAKNELARQLDDLKYLHLLGTRVWPLMELEPLLDEILVAVAAMQGAEMALIRLYDPATQELRVATSLGFPEAYLSRVDPLPLGTMVCGMAAQQRASLVFEDVETEPSFAPYLPLARIAGYRSACSTPLIARNGDLLGTIATHFREPHRPAERQMRLVELYARQVADLVENARHRRAMDGEAPTSTRPPGSDLKSFANSLDNSEKES